MNREPTALTEDVTIIEQKMSSLERENFDLKMRLFYKEKESLKDNSTLEDEAERVVGILQTRDDTYDQLRRANEEAYNTISELRAELQLVKASKEGSNSAYEGLLHKNQRLASLQLEENLKRERQAAQAIASHDASLIAKLEEDLELLQATHEADNKLVSECAGRVAELMGIVEEKNETIQKQSSALDAANEHIEVLTDRVSRQEIFLIRGDQQDLLPKSDSGNLPIENTSSRDHHHYHHYHPSTAAPSFSPSRNLSASSLHPSSSSMNPGASSSSSNRDRDWDRERARGRDLSSSRSSPYPHEEEYGNEEAVGSSMSLRPAPRLGQPFLSSSSSSSGGRQSTPNTHRAADRAPDSAFAQQQHFSLADLSSTVGTAAGHPRPASLLPGSRVDAAFPRSPAAPPSTLGSNASPFPPPRSEAKSPNFLSSADLDMHGFEEDTKPSGYLSEEAKKLINAEIEIEVLMEETASLKQTLKEEKVAFRKLEETLARVRSSSEEITLLEAEEIARLEGELERVSEERDKFRASCRSLEMQHELQQQQQQRDRSGGSVGSPRGSQSQSQSCRGEYSSPGGNSNKGSGNVVLCALICAWCFGDSLACMKLAGEALFLTICVVLCCVVLCDEWQFPWTGYDNNNNNNHRESLHHSGEYKSSANAHKNASSKAKDLALFDMYR
jgi:hypothetical protein